MSHLGHPGPVWSHITPSFPLSVLVSLVSASRLGMSWLLTAVTAFLLTQGSLGKTRGMISCSFAVSLSAILNLSHAPHNINTSGLLLMLSGGERPQDCAPGPGWPWQWPQGSLWCLEKAAACAGPALATVDVVSQCPVSRAHDGGHGIIIKHKQWPGARAFVTQAIHITLHDNWGMENAVHFYVTKLIVPLHIRSKKDRHWSGSMTHVTGCHLSPDPGHNNAGSLSKDKNRITGSLHWCGHGTVSEKEGKIRNQSRDTLRLQLSLHPTDVVRPSSPVSHCLWSGCFLCSYKSQHIQNHFPLIHPI